MNTSSAALARNTLFFAQGGVFALLMATIPGLYLPRGPMLLAGAALGLCGLGLVFLVVAPKARSSLSPATEATIRYLVAVGAACTEAERASHSR
ncbi:MAG: hypothetical protein P8080_13705 [Gammaproteobacteria bacterium]